MQTRQPHFFRYFLTNILLFNMLILSGLVFRYLQFQTHAAGLKPYVFVLPGLLVVMAALKLGWLYAYILMNKTLPADMASKRTAKLIARGAVVIFLSYLGAGAIALLMRLDALEKVVFIMLIQAGKTNQEIADELFISVATVKDHNHNLFRKCGVRNRVELANLFR